MGGVPEFVGGDEQDLARLPVGGVGDQEQEIFLGRELSHRREVSERMAETVGDAAALGDIGKHFPDTDPRFKDVSSIVLLQHAIEIRLHGVLVVSLETGGELEHRFARTFDETARFAMR